jgi:protein dithiol:quinone oxidoreductase
MRPNRRLFNAAGAIGCFAMLGYALYAQYLLHLEPCPLCMFQRITILALGIVFALAAIQHPRTWGSYVYAVLIALAALATIGVAARHLYVQSLPPGSIPACGAPLAALLRMFPVMEVIRKVLRAGGECAEVNWTFLGLAMPGWVLLCAAVLGAFGVLTNLWLVEPHRRGRNSDAHSPA